MARGWVSVIPVLFLDFLVIALPAGVLPIVLNSHYGQRAYLLGGWAATCKGLLAFLTSPALGALSDVIGRKWLFFACVLGTAAPYAVLGLGASLDTHLILLGLSGLLSATFPLAFAFIADSVAPQQRASAFGATIGLGLGGAFFVGPALGATIDELLGTSAVFKACVAVTAFNAAFAVVVLHEPPSRGRLTWSELLRRSNPCRSFTGLLVASRPMRLLSVITLFYYLALWGFLANKGVYARRRFQLTSRETAAQLSVFGAVSSLSQTAGLSAARKVASEAQIARACFACAMGAVLLRTVTEVESPLAGGILVGAMLIYGFATDSRLLYPAMALLGLSVGGFATVSSLCSQVVPHALVGEAQGVIASMKALMEGVGPLAFAWAMPRFEHTALPGAPWLGAAALTAVSLALCCLLEECTNDAIDLEQFRGSGERLPLQNSRGKPSASRRSSRDSDSNSEDFCADEGGSWESPKACLQGVESRRGV